MLNALQHSSLVPLSLELLFRLNASFYVARYSAGFGTIDGGDGGEREGAIFKCNAWMKGSKMCVLYGC